MMPKSEKKKMPITQRYAWTGAAIGLYFAIFAKPSGVPDIPMAIALAVIAALVTVIVRSWKKKRTFIEILKDFLGMLLLYSAFLTSMQLRKYANDLGGRLLVGVVTVAIGVITGLFFGARAKSAGQE
jgi:hypothetical protein